MGIAVSGLSAFAGDPSPGRPIPGGSVHLSSGRRAGTPVDASCRLTCSSNRMLCLRFHVQ